MTGDRHNDFLVRCLKSNLICSQNSEKTVTVEDTEAGLHLRLSAVSNLLFFSKFGVMLCPLLGFFLKMMRFTFLQQMNANKRRLTANKIGVYLRLSAV
ncbi:MULTISPECIES: hypothetical protein [unclassified Microcoleus]|uniref:hypothetical protein n=1 Tax=unclassified Microcoleus TaxID=2642155 RepID=UPI002FD2BFBD